MTESLDVISVMPRSSMIISIKPHVFFWLLDKSGWTIPDIAHKIEYDESEIRKWKDASENIKLPLSKVEIISKTIERPLSAFFMANPPKDYKLPKDFRKLPDTIQGEIPAYSKETLLAFRKASHLQEVTMELLTNIGDVSNGDKIPKYVVSDNADYKAEIERKKSDISLDVQVSLDSPTNAYGVWRDWMASQGIFVFHFDIPLDDARGFCLIESNPKVIVISKKDAIRGRIFSLLHEYAHILLRESVICNIDSDSSLDADVVRIENWCNKFAGAFLLPKKEITKDFEDFKLQNGNFMKFLKDMSDKYKTSRESILVRLRFLDLINYPYYFSIKEAIKSENQERKLKEKKEREKLKAKGIEPAFIPQQTKDKTVWTDRGANFVTLVLKNANSGHITERDVMDILELRVDHLVKLLPT